MKFLPPGEPESRSVRSFTIDGKRLEVTLLEEGERCWRWSVAVPGEIALSGEAESEMQALHFAGRAGRTLARGIMRHQV